MSENVKISIVIGTVCILFIIAFGLVARSCGTEIEATCPGGAQVRVIERGGIDGVNQSEGVCEELEGK